MLVYGLEQLTDCTINKGLTNLSDNIYLILFTGNIYINIYCLIFEIFMREKIVEVPCMDMGIDTT